LRLYMSAGWGVRFLHHAGHAVVVGGVMSLIATLCLHGVDGVVELDWRTRG
jgi:hypothetical protein